MSMRKCSGCKKLKADEAFFDDDVEILRSRCKDCLQKKKKQSVPSSNIVWNTHSELKQFTDDHKTHPYLTQTSEIKLKWNCNCGNAFERSIKEILENPYCERCREYFTNKLSINSLFEDVIEKISSTDCYDEFCDLLAKQNYSSQHMGQIQEIFAKFYFQSHRAHYGIRRYYAKILKEEIPEECKLTQRDYGVDGVIIHTDDSVSLVQVKFRKDVKTSLPREAIGNMGLEALTSEKLKHLYLFSNTLTLPKNLTDSEKAYVKFISYSVLSECNWQLIQEYCRTLNDDTPIRVKSSFRRRDWQKKARKFLLSKTKEFGRKTVVSACGTGKTFFAYDIMREYNMVLVIVPNLSLLSQWFEELASKMPERNYLLVGSDLPEENAFEDVSFDLTTDTEIIKDFLSYEHKEGFVVISTYQSLDVLEEGVQKSTLETFDLTIADEAHLTCGVNKNNFTRITEKNFPSDNILFLTATPKIFIGNNLDEEECVSMDNKEIYGDQYEYTLYEAIEDNVVSNYEVIIGCGLEKEDEEGNASIEFRARFLKRAVLEKNLNSVLVCSTSHANSKRLYDELVKLKDENFCHELVLMPKNASSSLKKSVIAKYNTEKPIIVFNVNVFSLGTNIPSLQSVMFNGDRKSVISIVQTLSRCLRKHERKEKGFILIPCLIKSTDSEDDAELVQVRRVLSALATTDKAIREVVVARQCGKQSSSDRKVSFMSEILNKSYNPKEFEIETFDRLSRNLFGSYKRFELLLEFCIVHKRLPLRKEEYKKVKIGSFLDSLLSDKNYKEQREAWLQQLRDCNETVRNQLEEREANRIDEQKKASRSVPSEKRFDLLLEYCNINKRLPLKKEEYKQVKIGSFLNALLDDKQFKEQREEWLQQLRECNESVRNQLEARLRNRTDEKKKASRSVPTQKRFELLLEYCIINERLPVAKEEYKEVKIGNFLDSLLGGKQYKEQREGWLQQLKECNESVRNQLEERLATRTDEEKKAHRNVPSEKRFEMLLEFCIVNGRLPLQKEEYNGVKIGNFLVCLLSDKQYKEQREDWLQQLRKCNENVRKELEERLVNITDEEKKAHRNVPSEKRFELLFEFCIVNGRLSQYKEEYKEVKIGSFLDNLLSGKYFKEQREGWLQQLKDCNETVRNQIEARLANITDEKKKASRSVPTQKRFELLLEYCIINERLPVAKEEYNGVKIGSFLDNLLSGKYFKEQREAWLQQLRDCNETVRNQLKEREANRIDEQKKAHRNVPTQKRFELLLEYCIINERLPVAKEEYNEVKIGSFLVCLLGGKQYKEQQEGWLQQLRDCNENVRNQIEIRLKNRNQESSSSE